jgi:hypothetical protein
MSTTPSATATISLWPEGPPTQIEHDAPEVASTVRAGVAAGTTFLRNVSESTVHAVAPQRSHNGIGIIVVPGGGGKVIQGLHADWSAADHSSELHAFARGGHGFGTVRQGLPSDHWTELFVAC